MQTHLWATEARKQCITWYVLVHLNFNIPPINSLFLADKASPTLAER